MPRAHTAASWPPRLIFRWAEGSSSRNRPAATAANIHAQLPFPTCRPKNCWTSVTASTCQLAKRRCATKHVAAPRTRYAPRCCTCATSWLSANSGASLAKGCFLAASGCAGERRCGMTRLNAEDPTRKPEFAEDWVNLVALAVNEENASGGRVVTAPTNGAAGIVPAVLHYAIHYTSAGAGDPDDVTVRFLLTAGAIGSLFKERASISGAEVGCQGEVGSAAAMAAAGLAEILGGTPRQVENAAEIAMEHSLGLTCDPIAGLVQIPCIERNAISAGKAINAARMALRGDGIHRVTLDQVIDTMRATGADMHTKYKETSAGGLAINVAVNIVEC
ncbi:L-serine dehydratase sdaA [Mycobacterium tuberculosis T92]|nr:L-serine dehydratase sdaA [Mycobacterium tuberculosis T92]